MSGGFVISHADGRPMYLQIMEQIKRRIAVGDWPEGHPIPSIRQLAVDLKVSVITVKRAYLELEREGVIATQHGKGSIVAAGVDVSTRLYEAELAKHLEEAVRLAALLRLGPREVQRRLRGIAERIADAERVRT
jgi:GntR family transcriptional regulator